jgi:putative oxidoreductase
MNLNPLPVASANPAPFLSTLWQRALLVRDTLDGWLNCLQPLAALLARVYVANVFISSGLTKLRDWETTVALFTDEYKVPLLQPEVAAVMGTLGELALPVFLVLGLGGRMSALGLFVVNAVAVVSLSDIAPAALQQHITWGVLLAGLAVFGSGRWAADTWLQAKPR